MQFCTLALVLPAILPCLAAAAADSAPEVPTFLKICRSSDPNLNECVKRSVEALKPYLRSGIAALHIPPCEPLRVPHIELNQSAGPVSVRSTYTNIRIKGGTNFVLEGVKIDTESDRIKLILRLPRLEMKSDYTMSGKILMLPITGQGEASGNYTDISAIVMIQGERYQNRKTEKTHFRVRDFYVDFKIGHASIHLENLFNGDDTLADAMNVFLNENWKTVAAEIKPALEDTVSELFKTFCNKIYSKYPLDMLLPP